MSHRTLAALALLLATACTHEASEEATPEAAASRASERAPESDEDRPGGWRLAASDSPYLRQHADNDVDWYAWGPEAFERARGGRQAGLSLHRLQRVPLVPRDGARVLRESRHRGLPAGALHQRQGRPRATPRRGFPLHASGAADDGQRWLATHSLPDSRGRPLLRRNLFPARAPARHAWISRTPGMGSQDLDRAAPEHREDSQLESHAADHRHLPTATRLGRERTSGQRSDLIDRGSRPDLRRYTEQSPPTLSAQHVAALPLPATAAHRHGRFDARLSHTRHDGVGRHARPRRRRFPPLQHRPPVEGAPLREDALRQRRAGGPLCRGLRPLGTCVLRRRGPRHPGMAHDRHAVAPRSLLRGPRCRQPALR